jgi:hypothetical protein
MHEISIIGKSGEPVARSNLVLCFFGKTTPQDWADAGKHALQAWLEEVPPQARSWALLGASASQFKAANEQSPKKCLSLLEMVRAKPDRLASFDLLGPNCYGPDFSFTWKADPDAVDPDADETNLLEMRFPAEWLDRHGSAAFLAWANNLAKSFRYDSGYAAISLLACRESAELEAGKKIGPLALKHWGYDVCNNDSTSYELGLGCRGAKWVVFLGHSLLGRLGGSQAVEARLAQYALTPSASGLMVATSKDPVIGDTNRDDRVSGLRPLAQVLEPVTHFGDYTLDTLFLGEEDKRARWERRFLEN